MQNKLFQIKAHPMVHTARPGKIGLASGFGSKVSRYEREFPKSSYEYSLQGMFFGPAGGSRTRMSAFAHVRKYYTWLVETEAASSVVEQCFIAHR